MGRLDAVVRMEEDGARVLNHDDYTLFPVDNTVPEDPYVVDILEEYSEELNVKYNTEQVIAYASEKLTRYGSDGGDSMLGKFRSRGFLSGCRNRKHLQTHWGFEQIFHREILQLMIFTILCHSTIPLQQCF